MKRRKLIAATQTLVATPPAAPLDRQTQVGVNFIDQANLVDRSTVIGRYFFVGE